MCIKAFGFADVKAKKPMEVDTPFRMYSMTKVMTSTIALVLRSRYGEPSPDDEVSKFIPSFGRDWHIVEEATHADEAVEVRSLITGRTEQVSFSRRKAVGPMLVKHLMSECSGIGYEVSSDLDVLLGNALGTKRSFAISNALRQQICPTLYTSGCILGHDLTVAEFCDAIATAGVLSTEPGTISYGLGATVLGRIVEVVYEKHCGYKPLRNIFKELLFEPLGMSTACFFDKGLAGRLPTLYGLTRPQHADPYVVNAEDSIPPHEPPYSNQSDHFCGPMKYDSGDTGSVMTVADYSKFLECLLGGGSGPNGETVLPVEVVDELLRCRFNGLNFNTAHGTNNGMSNDGACFSTGWVTQEPGPGTPKQNYWSGYANTHFRLYVDDGSYIILGVQCMDHSGTGFVNKALREPCIQTFLQNWT